MSIYLKNATYIDWQTLEFINADIKVTEGVNGKIKFIKEIPFEKQDSDKVIDCTNKFVTKSFVNGHHHIYSALATGMPASPSSPENFLEILKFI